MSQVPQISNQMRAIFWIGLIYLGLVAIATVVLFCLIERDESDDEAEPVNWLELESALSAEELRAFREIEAHW